MKKSKRKYRKIKNKTKFQKYKKILVGGQNYKIRQQEVIDKLITIFRKNNKNNKNIIIDEAELKSYILHILPIIRTLVTYEFIEQTFNKHKKKIEDINITRTKQINDILVPAIKEIIEYYLAKLYVRTAVSFYVEDIKTLKPKIDSFLRNFANISINDPIYNPKSKYREILLDVYTTNDLIESILTDIKLLLLTEKQWNALEEKNSKKVDKDESLDKDEPVSKFFLTNLSKNFAGLTSVVPKLTQN